MPEGGKVRRWADLMDRTVVPWSDGPAVLTEANDPDAPRATISDAGRIAQFSRPLRGQMRLA